MAEIAQVSASNEELSIDIPNRLNSKSEGRTYQPEATGPFVHAIGWSDLTIDANDRKSKHPRRVLSNSIGHVTAGQMCAIMGPSGCGKSTLISALSGRPTHASAVRGSIQVNGRNASCSTLQSVSCFVDQQDMLIGALTVSELMKFSAKFTNTRSHAEVTKRVASLIERLGLVDCKDNQVAPLFRKHISGGQKRRVSIGCQLLTEAKIVFLDEPTSGLDSVASLEVMSYVQQIARHSGCIIMCAIHQPSSSILHLFDKLLLLSGGETMYFGETASTEAYFHAQRGIRLPRHVGLSEGLLNIINFDFDRREDYQRFSPQDLSESWQASKELQGLHRTLLACQNCRPALIPTACQGHRPSQWSGFSLLLERMLLKSYRDISGYWIRLIMYACFAFVLGTVFFRLPPEADHVPEKVLELFFAPVFLSFMNVAYAPSFIEDYETFVRDYQNRFYGPGQLVVANFVVGCPYLLLFSLLTSVFIYWISGFRPSVSGFCIWIVWYFLNFLSAESLIVLAVSLFPNFVVVLSLVSFVNSLWIAVAGVAIPVKHLNVFYRYGFHYIDPMTYVFRGLMVNEFGHQNYSCGAECKCNYPGVSVASCTLPGQAVLDNYGISKAGNGSNFGILAAMIVVYRVLAYLLLQYRVWRC